MKTIRLSRAAGVLLVAILLAGSRGNALAVRLAGVFLPDTRDVAGAHLVLNGIGLRTYSFLRIRIYLVGLYLEHRNGNAESILASPETKLLEVHFLHDVGQTRAQQAWQKGFADNCTLPCRLDSRNVARFIAAVPAIHRGDVAMFLFTRGGLTITYNGRPLGTITNPHFARQVLAVFIGPVPPTPAVKRGLLGQG